FPSKKFNQTLNSKSNTIKIMNQQSVPSYSINQQKFNDVNSINYNKDNDTIDTLNSIEDDLDTNALQEDNKFTFREESIHTDISTSKSQIENPLQPNNENILSEVENHDIESKDKSIIPPEPIFSINNNE